MRLLLNEQYSTEIAAQLRSDGYDVASAHDVGLVGIADRPLLETAATEERALVTNNVRDFAPLAVSWAAEGRDHHGLIFTSDRSLPRSRNTIGLFVDVLRRLLDAEPATDALRNRCVGWGTSSCGGDLACEPNRPARAPTRARLARAHVRLKSLGRRGVAQPGSAHRSGR